MLWFCGFVVFVVFAHFFFAARVDKLAQSTKVQPLPAARLPMGSSPSKDGGRGDRPEGKGRPAQEPPRITLELVQAKPLVSWTVDDLALWLRVRRIPLPIRCWCVFLCSYFGKGGRVCCRAKLQ